MKRNFARIGAAFYGMWAALHVLAGLSLMLSALNDINAHVRKIGTGATAAELPVLPEGSVVSAIVAFHSFNMIWIGGLVGVVAARWNWRNSTAGFWSSFALTGFLDVGLFAFLILPGYMAWTDGLVGPLLFVLGLSFTALGHFGATRGASGGELASVP